MSVILRVTICTWKCLPHISRKVVSEYKVNKDRNILHTTEIKKAKWVSFLRNCSLKHMLLRERYQKQQKWLEDEEEDVNSYWKALRKSELLWIKRENARWHCVETLLWKEIWACRNTGYGMNGSLGIDRRLCTGSTSGSLPCQYCSGHENKPTTLPTPPPLPPTFACNVNTEQPKCYIANKNTLFPGGRSEELCISTTLPALAMSTRIIPKALPRRPSSGFVNIDRDPLPYKKKRYLAQPINVSTQKEFNTL